jgi:hypothetical protein
MLQACAMTKLDRLHVFAFKSNGETFKCMCPCFYDQFTFVSILLILGE